MIDQLESLYQKIYGDESTKNPKVFIQECEKHQTLLNDFKTDDPVEYFRFTRLISDYGLMLFQVNRFSKSLKYLNKAISLFENNNEYKGKDLFQENMYVELIVSRAINRYRKDKLNLAENDFKYLLNKFPSNKNYINWLKKVRRRKKRILSGRIFLILIIIGVILSLLNRQNNSILELIWIIVIICGLIGSFIVDLVFRIKYK